MKYLKYPILTILIFISISCVSNRNDVDFFLNKDKKTQYFFPEKTWNSSREEIQLNSDWLYRTYPLENDDITKTIFNFTLSSKSEFFRKVPSKIVISSNNEYIEIPEEHISLIYIDKGKTRYTSWLASTDLDKLIIESTDELLIEIYINNKTNSFTSKESFIPHIHYYKEVILGIYP